MSMVVRHNRSSNISSMIFNSITLDCANYLEALTLLHIITFQKDHIWTEADDILLIDAHKIHGNHWSTIARCFPGWWENAIKNHWNTTKRSLKSKRRLKKKISQQAALAFSRRLWHPSLSFSSVRAFLCSRLCCTLIFY